MNCQGHSLPVNGSLVKIIRPPRMSYLREGDIVRVRYPARYTRRDDVRAWDERHNCGTFDRVWAWDWAVWETPRCTCSDRQLVQVGCDCGAEG